MNLDSIRKCTITVSGIILVIFVGKHKKVTQWVVDNSSEAIICTQVFILHFFQDHRKDHYIIHDFILQQIHLMQVRKKISLGNFNLISKLYSFLSFSSMLERGILLEEDLMKSNIGINHNYVAGSLSQLRPGFITRCAEQGSARYIIS